MLKTQLEMVQLWYRAADSIRNQMSNTHDDRGEVTAQTALIVLLVAAAIAAGAVIAAAMLSNANNIPAP